jgi:hypothetical protein
VVFDRLGDVLGGALSEIFLALGGLFAIKSILLVTVAIAGVGIYITRRMQKLYVRVLEQGLVDRAVELEVDTESELLTRSVLLMLSVKRDPTAALPAPAHPELRLQDVRPPITEPILQTLMELRSGNLGLVQRTLSTMQQPDPLLVPQIIILVAWDEIAPEALRVLRGSVDHVAGQMLDALLDEKTDFAIKRRLPRALAYSENQRTVQGLMHALEDSRFEVRFQCARALDVILQRHPEYRPAKETVFAIVEREMSVSRGVWDSRRLLDRRQSTDEFLFLDDVLKERAQLSWEHLFSLLALILPRGPLKVAFQAMHTDDRLLRGLALEYLDSVLPPSLRHVQTFFEAVPPLASTGEVDKDLTTRLMDARQSVSLKLAHVPSPGQENH